MQNLLHRTPQNKKQESLPNDVHYDIGLDVYSIKDGSLGVSWNVTHNGEVKDFKSEDLIIAIMIVMIAQAKKNSMTYKETQAMFAKEIDLLYNGYEEITDKEDGKNNNGY